MSLPNDLFACPRCDAPLEQLRCAACQIEFPLIDGVPWLVADPAASQADWRNRWHLELARLEAEREAALRALEGVTSPVARLRLETLAQGCISQQKALRALLGALGVDRGAARETYLALRTRLPTQMGLTSYAANVYRDWCWGQAENEAALAAVREAITDDPQRVLVLGAGAGRLAYDLHHTLSPALTVALDLNPFLTAVLARMARGETVRLTEFPLAPKSVGAIAIERALSAPVPARDGFVVVLGDALRPPFRPGSFDVVLTPWLIDVLDAPVGDVLARVNRLLSKSGRWIGHGSLTFTPPARTDCASLEELIEIASARGFEDARAANARLPYLNCPDSRHARIEEVVTVSATKNTDTTQPARHQNLPDWIVRGDVAVPLSPAFQQQALATRMHAFIMTLIDGKRSLKDIASLLEQQQLMPRADAEAALRGFLIRMYEEARTGGGP